jgi:hypothetical protein
LQNVAQARLACWETRSRKVPLTVIYK